MQVIDKILELIRKSSTYNSEIQSAPACILWTDKESQFVDVVPTLQDFLPELFILGKYEPLKKMGPAIWLRCVLSGMIEDIKLDKTPIIYLPGFGRQDLRVVENANDEIKPLIELQYRGTIWSQINAKDWTILALLKTDQGGLGLDVATDTATKNSMKLAFKNFLDEELNLLKNKRLDADYFNSLLSTKDPEKEILNWINLDQSYPDIQDETKWYAFNEICQSKYELFPKKDGVLVAAEKLAYHEGVWENIWNRYCEAPHRYVNIPEQIKKCKLPEFDLFATNEEKGKWPQWNDSQEKILEKELKDLENKPHHDVIAIIQSLESEHKIRRELVWAELGYSKMSQSLKYLAIAASLIKDYRSGGTVEDIFKMYVDTGWKIDAAIIDAIKIMDNTNQIEIVNIAIRALYLPWIEENARYLQNTCLNDSYPGKSLKNDISKNYNDDECIIFVDGLRFDSAKKLVAKLKNKGIACDENPYWNSLPSVTATGKPAVSPVKDKIIGIENNADFEPSVAETGQSLKGGYHLKKLLTNEDWIILEKNEHGNGKGRAWCEFGDIDHEGHDRGISLAKHLDSILDEIILKIESLKTAGWKNIRIVTDHGWLLIPKGLPKVELPSSLTNSKWGRCAVLKNGATTNEKTFPWYWNEAQHFVLADGVSCFKKGDEYNHGGLSAQECIVMEIQITNESGGVASEINISEINWRGLRCTVVVDGVYDNLQVDIRTNAGDEATSIALGKKGFKEGGISSIIVEDEDNEGSKAFIVILDKNGSLIKQESTVVGGN